MESKRRFYYFAATPAGSLWELHAGHVFTIKGEEWLCTGFSDGSENPVGVYICRNNHLVLIHGNTELWDTLSVRRMSAVARDNWERQ